MASRLEASVRGGKPAAPKLVLFSGHDTTVMPLLVAYGVEPERWHPALDLLPVRRG